MCEYCEDDKFILEDRYERGAASSQWMHLHSDGLLVFNTDGNEYERGEVYINYCPMCGRKLTEADEWHEPTVDYLGLEELK